MQHPGRCNRHDWDWSLKMAADNGESDASRSSRGTPGNVKPPRRVVVVAKAKSEGREILTEEQYWDLVGYVKRLFDFGDRAKTADLDIRAIGDFFELRVKGGFIRRINLRVYFAFVAERNEVVVLMTYKK